MDSKTSVINEFKWLFNSRNGGFESFISNNTADEILNRISEISSLPITFVQMNQLLSLAYAGTISDGFYSYYWNEPQLDSHIYDVKTVEDYPKNLVTKSNGIIESQDIVSIQHLRWGFRRIMIDTLYMFGNINKGFDVLRNKSYEEIVAFFKSKRHNTNIIKKRGEPIKFHYIENEDRYLISEMCCKTYEKRDNLVEFLINGYNEAFKKGIKKPRWKSLLAGEYTPEAEKKDLTLPLPGLNIENAQLYGAGIDGDEEIMNEDDIRKKCKEVAIKFETARNCALANTNLFLSLAKELDVYVATSMRTRQNFIEMASKCKEIFKNDNIKELNLRYFDPTVSAAESHEDKGLIECLMVKCCKVLIYRSGEKDSYGKDAEASIALCLGKPVIFLCEEDARAKFAKETHPLTRLVNFDSGVVNGAIVVQSTVEVASLLNRIFNNKMEYEIMQKDSDSGYYLLLEKESKSVIRIQTNDKLLSHSFWNNY